MPFVLATPATVASLFVITATIIDWAANGFDIRNVILIGTAVILIIAAIVLTQWAWRRQHPGNEKGPALPK